MIQINNFYFVLDVFKVKCFSKYQFNLATKITNNLAWNHALPRVVPKTGATITIIIAITIIRMQHFFYFKL